MKKEKSKFLKNLKRTWQFIKPCKYVLVGYALVSIIEGIIGALLPLVSSKIILNITDGLIRQLILSAIAVFFIEIVLYIMYYFKSFFFRKIYIQTQTSLQVTIARETLKLEIKEIDTSSSGLFIDRLNKDTSDISEMFMQYTYWLSYVISKIGVLVTIYILNKYLFVYCLMVGIIIFIINKKRLSKQYEIQKELKKLNENKTSLIGELVRGIRDIKVLNASENILKQTTKKITDASKEEIKIIKIRNIYQYLENNIRSLSDLIFIILGCILFKKDLITIPTFVIIYNYQGRIQNLLSGIVELIEYNKKFVVSSDRVFEIIYDDKFQKEKFGNIHKKKLEGNIKFKKVKFSYNEDNTLINNMTFEIEPNQTVAFVGKSGAGKTTIFNLITKLYNIDSGEITFDGININDLDEKSLRNNMSIITQNSYIFNFTIRENLLIAKENATMKEIRNACKLACIDDFIMSLPEKYNTILGENGIILSGGQKQRIAIARALLMKTEIILFDEATSALDNETQDEIQKAIHNMKGEFTILIIAHRLSTVINSNKIFVVDKGKIIASGTHKELLKTCKFYKTLYDKDLKVNE